MPHSHPGRSRRRAADHTTGISKGTWLLIFGELLCFGVFGVCESDPRLIVLGATGVAASLLVLARVARPRAGAAGIARPAGAAGIARPATWSDHGAGG